MDAMQLIEHTTDAWNNRDLEAYMASYAEDCEIVASDFVGRGHAGVNEFWDGFMEPFPDNKVTVFNTIGNADIAVEEGVLEGTHTGPFPTPDGNVAATGRRISSPFAGIHTVRDGKIVSSHFYSDQLTLLEQLALSQAEVAE